MTNPDTNTLNGSLEQLGITMADNLTTKGVTASATDGLTTLAGKVLDINSLTEAENEEISNKLAKNENILKLMRKINGTSVSEA